MKLKALLLSIILLTSLASSQTESEYVKTTCLQFGFNGLNLAAVNAGVGGKTWTSEHTALGLSIAGSHSFDRSDPNPSQSGTTVTRTVLQIQFGIEGHMMQSDNFSPYITGALFARHETYWYEHRGVYVFDTNESHTKKTSIGVLFGVGAEYWITKRLSLAGQHMFQLSYTSGTEEVQEYSALTKSAQTLQGVNIGLGTSSLILALYF
jgi:hypothetical protein